MRNTNNGVRVSTKVRAGALTHNHNSSLPVSTKVRAGAVRVNHNETARF